MRRLQKRPELVTSDQGDILPSAPVNKDGLAAVCHLIEQGLQVRTCVRVGGFVGHRSPPSYMYSFTVREIPETVFRGARWLDSERVAINDSSITTHLANRRTSLSNGCVKLATALVVVVIAATVCSGAFASQCGRTTPFLEVARTSDLVFIGRAETGGDMSVLRVLRGTESRPMLRLGQFIPGPINPGTKWMIAVSPKPGGDRYVVPECSEWTLRIAGDWALGTITESRKSWWQAATLDEVNRAILNQETVLESVLDPGDAVPFAGSLPANTVSPKIGRDCNVTSPTATARVLIDEEGFVVRANPPKGVARCVSSAVQGALSAARLEPVTRNGTRIAAWLDLVVPLPYAEPGEACSGVHAMRPATAVVTFDGKRLVITARASSIDESSLEKIRGSVTRVQLGRQLDALDVSSAPRLVDFVDDDPCKPVFRDGEWVPGPLIRECSIDGADLCVYWNRLRENTNGRTGASPPKEWFAGASTETVQITIDTKELTLPGELFRGDVVLLVITPGKTVRPAKGILWKVPSRLIVGKDDGHDWPRLYSNYLDALCRSAETWVLEATSDLRWSDATFAAPLEIAEWQSLGATWYPKKTAEGYVPNLNLARLRVLREQTSSAPLRLVYDDRFDLLEPRIHARRDADTAPDKCAAAETYRRDATKRREEEERNRLRLVDPRNPLSGD